MRELPGDLRSVGHHHARRQHPKKITGWGKPTPREVDAAVRRRKPNVFRFADDGIVPNNGKLPLIVYRGPIRAAGASDPAALFEVLFERNGWKNSWRDGIYDYVHYHSQIHEVLGIAHGHVTVRFGGSRGRALTLKAGDVAILPAGTGHKRKRNRSLGNLARKFRILETQPAETRLGIRGFSARDGRGSTPETGRLAANLRKWRHFRGYPKLPGRDPGGWLGRQDSNLGMAESKSDCL